MLETLVRKNSELELDRLRLIKKHLGQTSERVSEHQLALMLEQLAPEERPADAIVPSVVTSSVDGSTDDAATSGASSTKTRGHGRKPLPSTLRRVEIEHSVPASDRVCSACGKDKTCIGHATSEVLQFKPAEFFVEIHKREKLACEAHPESGVAIADAPEKVIEKGRPGSSVLARVVIGKYEDHEPLHRMRKMFSRLGIDIAVSTLADWVTASAAILNPIAALIRKLVLDSVVLQGDDTGLKVLDEKAPGGAKRGHLWFYVGDRSLCSVVYTPDWTKNGPALFLAARRGGYFVADAYKGWDHLYSRDENPLIEVGCWAHARRPFVEIADRGDPRAAVMLHHVKKLYEVEKDATDAGDGEAERLARRRDRSRGVIDHIAKWCAEIKEREPPKSALATAVGYVFNQWLALTRFLEDGALPLDNTVVERALRGVAQGRKNFLFAGSDEGAIRAATIYTCMATCKLNGVEPTAWLTDVIAKIQTEQWPHGRLRELVPDEWRKTAPAHALIDPKR
jgi:transposase